MLQAWGFVPGSNFVLEMDKAAQQAKRTITVLSPTYLAASFPQTEWGSAFAGDPTGAERKLVPVRVAECDPPGLLGQIVHIDLVALDEAQAHERLLDGMRERLKPSQAPAFPGLGDAGEASPSFPGEPEQTSAVAAATSTAGRRTWVKVDDVITAIDELDDAGETITLKGRAWTRKACAVWMRCARRAPATRACASCRPIASPTPSSRSCGARCAVA